MCVAECIAWADLTRLRALLSTGRLRSDIYWMPAAHLEGTPVELVEIRVLRHAALIRAQSLGALHVKRKASFTGIHRALLLLLALELELE